MVAPIELLKFNLQERQYPYFNEEELQMLLETNDNNVLKASFKGCTLKATADDGINVGPIKTASNREYWIGMADQYKAEYERSLSGTNNGVGYKTSMKRADGQ
ncbi:hypothetical protein H7E67_10335 [Clostridium gasigenes]|uniref:hypothetical protein n=1 Tax=Clostridium gasigenes TaxID=94869 RepID=UPI001628F8E6|nr:hypothetical protein [Clostridium gasigenes]MBB6623824.1 hypothetical protein [Clostridium gasigenes]